ncbi:hypothetical protein SERLADRAFT_458787 [Serpula lacrymans var. lacrymans S7.9]|uniref:Metallo-beta-lactamase domain-containing protein n=1 Tax=Serpula lacrymans var. lacrymans (strain S7.9) TaxID=578457 RepID=F8NKF1_SERL9|nr:uncharacterized protein SERLADRAFT_458787 [Serpula lacrymans var. lacrymans S7.9]EGO28417.1 hypothetical protein SERLADRAFT_458787 [Serpula lacrymans var. lacrymans S7.9]
MSNSLPSIVTDLASTAIAPIELVFLGTGTSSSLPHLDCLTAPPDREPCSTCLSTLTPEGKKNIRRNTSAALRVQGKDGNTTTIVIDVGKNFQAAAVEWFPKYNLRRIDAVIITHAHADAMNGLDDLRGWTLGGAIQSHIDVYVSLPTFREVQRAFPYLVSKEFASGGGDVPEFAWHIIDDKVPFEINGIRITPFTVHHGRLFTTTTTAPPAFTPTPYTTQPSTPSASGISTPVRQSLDHGLGLKLHGAGPGQIHPYFCFGFIIQDSMIYLSDVSHIPEDTWKVLKPEGKDPPQVLVIDCLRLNGHTSHMGLQDSLAAIRRLGAKRNYWTGFGHEVAHDEYVTIGKATEGSHPIDMSNMTETEKRGVELIEEGKEVWVRPAHDGLRVFVSSDGVIRDETYD